MATSMSDGFVQRMFRDYADQAVYLDRPMSMSLHTGTTIRSRTAYTVHGSLTYRPEQVHGQVFRSGDTVTVEWTDADDALRDDDTRTWVSSSTGFTAEEVQNGPYPCQLCWAVARWPWEPLRSCPAYVDVELTYCDRHRP